MLLAMKISTFCGCIFAATAACSDPTLMDFILVAILAGALIGFFTSPAVFFAISDPETRPSFVTVLAPTLFVSFFSGLFTGPLPALLLTVCCYIGLCVAVGVLAKRRRRSLDWYDASRCSTCGYDLAGLDSLRCPECGNIARARPKLRDPRERVIP
jgi:hypothetical protein